MATRATLFEALLAGLKDSDGNVLALGTVSFYVPGTTTPKQAWTDKDKGTAVTQVTLDPRGAYEVYGDGWYKVVIEDASGGNVDTWENVFLRRPSFRVVSKIADYTATTDDDLILVDTSAGNVTVTLPAAATAEHPIIIQKTTSDSNTVIIDGSGSETINTSATHILTRQYEAARVISDGANYTTAGAVSLATDAETKAETETVKVPTVSSLGAVLEAFGKTHWGLTLSNGTDTAHDIDIAVGACRESGNSRFIYLSTAITKQIDADWAAGTDAGGFPTGLTIATNTWYRVFLIYDATNDLTDAGFDTSATAANLLADATDYTLYRQIGWVLTNATSDIVQFHHSGDFIRWDVPVEDQASTSMSTSAALKTITAAPGSIAAFTVVHVVPAGGSIFYGLYTETRQTDTTPSATAYDSYLGQISASPMVYSREFERLLDSSSQIRTRGTSTSVNHIITTIGYTFLWDS